MHNNGSSLTLIDFHHHFQPIFDLVDKRVIGYEALIRSWTSLSPDRLLRLAEEQGKLSDVDAESVLKAIAAFHGFRDDELLFVNVFPATLASPRFQYVLEELVGRFEKECNRIVFEINETVVQSEIWQKDDFIKAVARLKQCGFMLALDDVGEGTTTFRKIIDIQPDFIKLDKFFASGLCRSEKVRKAVKLFAEYCSGHARLVLEGIETEEQCKAAESLGVTIGQGYWLGKPAPLDFDTHMNQK